MLRSLCGRALRAGGGALAARHRRRRPPARAPLCPLVFPPLQLQQSAEWDALVDRAFDAMDVDGCGRIGPADLEHLLCGEGGCEVRGWGCTAPRCAALPPRRTASCLLAFACAWQRAQHSDRGPNRLLPNCTAPHPSCAPADVKPPQAADWLDAALREADVQHSDRHIDRTEFRKLMARFDDTSKLWLFEARLAVPYGGSNGASASSLASLGSLSSVSDARLPGGEGDGGSSEGSDSRDGDGGPGSRGGGNGDDAATPNAAAPACASANGGSNGAAVPKRVTASVCGQEGEGI